jgi:hypothetical protein
MMLYDKRWEQPAETKRKRKTWRDILLKAADIIEEGGWCQHSYHVDDGRHCAMGAMNPAANHHSALATAHIVPSQSTCEKCTKLPQPKRQRQ